MVRNITAIAALALAAGSAQATFFSFSSDRNTDGPTIASTASRSVRDGRPFDLSGTVIVDFAYDVDENGPASASIIPARFEFSADMTSYSVTAISTGDFVHAWTLSGTYRFFELTSGVEFFSASFGNGLMTNHSDSATQLSTAGSFLSNKSADGSLTFMTAGPLAGVGVNTDQSFAFSLSAFRSAANGGRVGVAADGSFLSQWKSEGSWSASAVPAPGALALLGLAGLAATRRKR